MPTTPDAIDLAIARATDLSHDAQRAWVAARVALLPVTAGTQFLDLTESAMSTTAGRLREIADLFDAAARAAARAEDAKTESARAIAAYLAG